VSPRVGAGSSVVDAAPFCGRWLVAPTTSVMRPSPLALARGALLGVALSVALGIAADPDLWGHLKYGLDVLDGGGVAPADRYSFTSDRSWVNHEWLFEVVLGLAYRAAGPRGLQLLAAAFALSGVLLARASGRRAGLGGVWLDVVSVAVFLLGIAPLTQTIRPQVASASLFLALLAIIRAYDTGSAKHAAWLPPLFLLWANVHGAWVLAGGVLAIWATGRLVESPRAPARIALFAVCAMAAVATLGNPHGSGLWRFLIETVRFERADIIEWHAVSTDTRMLFVWLAVTVVLAIGTWRAPRDERIYAAMCAFLAFASFRVMRILPFYAMAVSLLVAPRLILPCGTETGFARRDWVGAASMCLLCITIGTMGAVGAGCVEPRGRFTVDPLPIAFLKENGAAGRLLVSFDWGEYAAWHLSPALRVSIDGRRETVYSAGTIAAHRELVANGSSARASLDRLSPDYVWLPGAAPLASALDAWGWQRIFESSQSVVWTKASAAGRAWGRPSQTPSNPCFPGF
jgi:hypothetical protein